MVRKIIIIVFGVVTNVAVMAQEQVQNWPKRPYDYQISAHIGTDLGAAIPWPISNLTSRGDKFSGTPIPKITVGLRYTKPINFNWAVAAELNHKRITMDAKTRVTNQAYNDFESNAVRYFTGTAEAHLDFPMWELPIYCKYTLNDDVNSFILGFYGSWIRRPKFESVAKKGFVGAEPNTFGSTIDSDFVMSFTDALVNWEVGGVVGYQVKISRNIDFGARLYLGFNDIFQRNKKYLDYKMVPIRGSFLLSYHILRGGA